MKITEFTILLTEFEGNKKGVNVAQMAEVVKVINYATEGMLYKYIKGCDESKTKAMLTSTKVPTPVKKQAINAKAKKSTKKA